MDTLEAQPLSVTVVVRPDEAQQLQRASGVVALAESFVIDSPTMAEEATYELRSFATMKKSVVAMREGFVENAKKIIAHADTTFNPTIKALEQADKILRARLVSWTSEQERLAADRRRKAEDEARIARQKADAEAAAVRAKADADARELQRKAEEARAAIAAAEAAGNAKAAAAAAASAAKLEEKAVAAIENGEAKAQAAALVAAASETIVEAAEKPAGFGTRANWIAECQDEQAALALIAAAIAGGRSDLLAILKIDMPAANRLAKALKGSFNVPGMTARNAPISTLRSAA